MHLRLDAQLEFCLGVLRGASHDALAPPAHFARRPPGCRRADEVPPPELVVEVVCPCLGQARISGQCVSSHGRSSAEKHFERPPRVLPYEA
jgi:hypothetical protein